MTISIPTRYVLTGSGSIPTLQGIFRCAGENGTIDINKDLSFNSYSTFSGLVDWKFTRKNHLVFPVSPFEQTRQTVLNRTITYQGQVFDVGLSTHAD